VLANSEVHKLPSDFTLVDQDLACGASKASALTQNALHTSTDSLLKTNSSPWADTPRDRTRRLCWRGTGRTVSQYPKDDLGTGATVKAENGDAKSGQDQALRLKEQGPLRTNKSTKLRGEFSLSLSYSHYPHLLLQTRRRPPQWR
jgi:hypothetical protein